MRDLCRARTDALQDLRRSRAQLKAFLLRNGYRYPVRPCRPCAGGPMGSQAGEPGTKANRKENQRATDRRR